MATTQQTPNTPAPEIFQEQALSQYLGCLAACGHVEALEGQFRKMEAAGDGLVSRYRLAVALALSRRTDDALVHLRAVIAAQPEHLAARTLAYRLLAYRARMMASGQDWAGLSNTIMEAIALCPPGVDPTAELGGFRQAMPVGHLRAGNRTEAARLWEEQLKQNPSDLQMVHSLALLHYWWARGTADDDAGLTLRWHSALSYWALLVNLDGFWANWKDDRTKTWGFELPSADLDAFRKELIREQIEHIFQEKADEYTQSKQAALAATYDHCLTASILERKSAGAWAQALTLLPKDMKPPGLLTLPAGFLFFQEHGLIPRVVSAAAWVGKQNGGTQCAADLLIYFSETGLGAAAVLSEERNKPDEAIQLLGAPSKAEQDASEAEKRIAFIMRRKSDATVRRENDKVQFYTDEERKERENLRQIRETISRSQLRSSPAFFYVRAMALAKRAAAHAGRGELKRALADWTEASVSAGKSAEQSGDNPFQAIGKKLKESVSEATRNAVQRECARLKTDKKMDEAIDLLDGARTSAAGAALLDILCIYLCDRADQKLQTKEFAASRADLERALKLQAGHARAKQLLSTNYNNEGCETKGDPAIALYEKALEYNPDSYRAKLNLAWGLKGKGVAVFNALNQYTYRAGCDAPIGLLERAAKLIGDRLSSNALPTLETTARTNQDGARRLVKDFKDDDPERLDLLRKILDDLVTMYNVRYRSRGY